MKTFATVAAFAASANALVGRGTNCCFHIDASGGAQGSLGQLDDGQNRVDGGLSPAQFCIDSNGGITDANGRGCIVTGPTTQFQCDEGSAPTTGFSINSQGQLEYQGKTDFVACETGMNGGLNVYIEESDSVTGCKDVTLSADKCSGSGAGSSPSGSGSSSSSVPAGSSAPSSPAPRPSSSTPAVSSVQVSSSAQASSPSGWAPVASSTAPAVSSAQPSSSSGWAPAPGSSQVSSVPGASSVPASSKSQVTVWTTKTNYECNSQSTPFPGVPSETPSGPQSQTVPVSWAPSSSGGSQPSSYPSSSQPGGGAQPSSSQPGGGAQPSSSQPGGGAQPSGTSSASQPSGTPPSSGKTCPTNLDGEYTTPHLIIPVDSSSPDTAPGTSYNGTISSSLTTLYKFDVPQSYADKTCSLVFLFPKQEDLETSAFTFSGDGKIDFASLESPVSEETSYSNMPGVKEDYGVTTVSPDNHYVISTFQCPAGEAVSYEMKNAGSTYLDFFEDYNPSPLGLYITTC